MLGRPGWHRVLKDCHERNIFNDIKNMDEHFEVSIIKQNEKIWDFMKECQIRLVTFKKRREVYERFSTQEANVTLLLWRIRCHDLQKDSVCSLTHTEQCLGLTLGL